jgi:hypothetical protein
MLLAISSGTNFIELHHGSYKMLNAPPAQYSQERHCLNLSVLGGSM